MLVNNPGIVGAAQPVATYPIADWRRILSINLDGVFYCCQAALPAMLQRGSGRIINMASISGKEGNPGHGRVFNLQGRRHRADQIAGQGSGHARHPGELHYARDH